MKNATAPEAIGTAVADANDRNRNLNRRLARGIQRQLDSDSSAVAYHEATNVDRFLNPNIHESKRRTEAVKMSERAKESFCLSVANATLRELAESQLRVYENTLLCACCQRTLDQVREEWPAREAALIQRAGVEQVKARAEGERYKKLQEGR